MFRTPSTPGPLCALAAALFMTACEHGAAAPGEIHVRDSAGILIVETGAEAWDGGHGWTVPDDPVLRIGRQEGDRRYLFSRVVGAVRLPGGSIVVGDGMSNQVRFYDAEGQFLRAVGGTGEGPGEFQYLRALKRCGEDTFYAFDLQWQAKVYTLEGELEREFRLLEPNVERSPYALSCSRSGEFVITGWGERAFELPIGPYAATAPAWVLDGDGEMLAELGEFVTSERIGSEAGSRPHPFGRSTVVAMGGDRVFVGPAQQLEVLVYRTDGALTSILRGPPQDLEVRPEHLSHYREELLEARGPDRRQAVEREIRELSSHPRFPSYDELLIDAEGNLWVRLFRKPGEEGVAWAVFEPEGRMLGTVSVPAGLRVAEIGRDYVLGVHVDGLGVERVQLHALEKGPA